MLKAPKLTIEQRTARAVRLQKLIRDEGWSDVLDLIYEREETILGKLLDPNCKDKEGLLGEFRCNRDFVNMVSRTIEGDYK